MRISNLVLLSVVLVLCHPISANSPAGDTDWNQAMEQAISALLEQQESMEAQGKRSKKEIVPREWPYEGVYREGGQIPPGYRVGGTAIVMRSLIETPGWKKQPERLQSITRGLQFLLEQSLLAPRMGVGFSGGYDVRDWGHIEALETLLRMKELGAIPAKAKKPVQTLCKNLIETLVKNEIPAGGWNYSRSRRANRPSNASPFMTAPAVMGHWPGNLRPFLESPLLRISAWPRWRPVMRTQRAGAQTGAPV